MGGWTEDTNSLYQGNRQNSYVDRQRSGLVEFLQCYIGRRSGKAVYFQYGIQAEGQGGWQPYSREVVRKPARSIRRNSEQTKEWLSSLGCVDIVSRKSVLVHAGP